MLTDHHRSSSVFKHAVHHAVFRKCLGLLVTHNELSTSRLTVNSSVAIILIRSLPSEKLNASLMEFQLVQRNSVCLTEIQATPGIFRATRVLPSAVSHNENVFVLRLRKNER